MSFLGKLGMLVSLAVCCNLFAPKVVAQSFVPPSSIRGTVADSSGAALSGATVILENQQRSRRWSVVTDSMGRYAFSGLRPGAYTLHVHQDGFSALIRTVRLARGESLKEPLVLSLATVVQQVNVSSGLTNSGLTARQIREGSARDLGAAMTRIAGVEKVRKAAIANDIAIRGMFHNNIATTIDGTRLYGAGPSQMDPPEYHVDLSEIDHVDVVKGPFDVTTEGVLGGYVKIITKTPDVRGVRFHTNVSTGSYGYYNPSATLQTGGKKLHMLLGYSYRTSEFYKDGNGEKVSDLGNYRNNDQNLQAFRTQSYLGKLAFEPAKNQSGEISYARQQSGILLYPYLMMDGVFDNADRFSARYNYVHPHGIVRGLRALGYINKVNHLMDNRLRTSAGTLPATMGTQVVSFTDGVRVDARLAGGFAAGYEFYRHYWNANGYMVMMMMGKTMTMPTHTLPGVSHDVNGAYVTYRHAFGGKVLLTTGGRFDHAYTNASKANPALYEAYHGTDATTATDSGVSGNVKLSWQALPYLSLFSGVGSNLRFAGPQELFYSADSIMGMGYAWVGNPTLTHPRDTEYNLGLTAKHGRYRLSPLAYFSKLDNYITLYGANREQAVSGVSSMKAESYANVQAYMWGGELTGSAPITQSLTLHGNLAYTRGTKRTDPQENMYSPNLFQVPPLTARLNLRYENRGLYAGLGSVVTGRQDHVDTDENERPTAGYSVFNIKGGYVGSRFHLEAGINNLLARQYTEFLSYARNPYATGIRLPEPGRNFFVNLSYTFGRE